MSEAPHNAPLTTPAMTDSPWFWVMVFSAAGLILLLGFYPKYAARQRRLEMQHYAWQEIARRQVEGPAEKQQTAPPEPGELIIPLWPLVGLLSASLAVSGALVWRSARRAPAENRPGRGAGP